MSSIRRSVSGMLHALLVICYPASASEPGFYPLGDLPDGSFYSHGSALSADGSVAVGVSISASGPEAFRWTAASGLVGIGDLAGGGFSSQAFGVSGDGSVLVGVGVSSSGEDSFRWTASGGMSVIAPSGGARAASPNGSIVVGRSAAQAYRWTAAEGAVGLGDLPGDPFNSLAHDLSVDGTVVVGNGRSSSGTEAFRWTAAGGMVGLGDLSGGMFFSEARGVSADGTVVVGFGRSATSQEAYRWTAATGMVSLSPGSFSFAVDVSADGSVIVGDSAQYGVYVWDPAHGMRSVQSMLGIDLSEWQWITAQGISDDGSTVIGFGRHLNGDEEAWIAVLPEPASLALLVLGGLALTRRQRLHRRRRA